MNEPTGGALTPWHSLISEDAELYGHQIVAPRRGTAHPNPLWAERCFYILFASDNLTLNAGRAVYPYDGRRTAFMSETPVCVAGPSGLGRWGGRLGKPLGP